MIWNNECRKTRRLLALWAGNDLEERDSAGVERHLAVCPQCREIRQGLHRAQQALEAVRPAAVPDRQLPTSVWPGVSRHLRSMDEVTASRGWREWLPTGAVAAVCVAMIAALIPPTRTADYQLTSDAVRVTAGSSSGGLHPVSLGSPRTVNRQGRSVQMPPADPDSYRNF